MAAIQSSPRFSVIIPCYNCAHLLPRAVASVRAQTVGGWEIVIVDDGSTDHVREVLAQWRDDPAIRVVHQENMGLAAARNAGIAAASGEYIFLLDADDEWRPEFIEKLAAAMEREGTLWCFCDTERMQAGQSQVFRCRIAGPNPLQAAFLTRFFPVFYKGFHRSILRLSGGYDSSLRYLEDLDLCARLLIAGHRFSYVPEALYVYHIQPASLTKVPVERKAGNLRAMESFYRKYYPAQAKVDKAIHVEYGRIMWELARSYARLSNARRDAVRAMATAVATNPAWCASNALRFVVARIFGLFRPRGARRLSINQQH